MHESLTESLNILLGTGPNRDGVYFVPKDAFLRALPSLCRMQVAEPCNVIGLDSGVFFRLRLIRPFFEFSVFVQTSEGNEVIRILRDAISKEVRANV